MTLVQVRLFRDSFQTPWGFRLQGGKDLNQPLTIQRVFANTPSEGELHRGDVIVAINGRDTSSFTHKAAQDAISGGGGQIELLVSRPPPGQVHIQPLSPVKDTRAPSFPNTKAPQVNIPIQTYKQTGPGSPSRVIPISPQKPSPPKPAPKPTTTSSTMSAAGHMPTKITLNKFGGGGMDFGYSPKTPPVQGYRPVQAPSTDYTDHVTQQRSHTQFSAPQPAQFSPPAPAAKGESGVAEEEYRAVSDRRKLFMTDAPRPPTVQRPHHSKPAPSFGKPRPGEEPVSFGVDYTKPHTMRQQPKPKPQRERPPAVNARRPDEDETDYSWSKTLRGDGRNLKPWEIEALEAQKYQSAPADSPYRPSMAPPTAPKPQLSPQSGAHSGQQAKKPVKQLGDRDWADSYVYQMVHSEEKTTTSSRQDVPGQPPRGETITTTRVTDESKYPGQAPQRHVTETVQRGGPPNYVFDNAIGMSDF